MSEHWKALSEHLPFLTMATGAWTGQETKIAQYYGSAWHFIAPTNGFAFWDIAAAALKRFNGTAWA